MNQELKKKILKTSFVTPFTQIDWGDYYSDTDYLNFEEHGVYWNLLKRYYTTGPFENNMKALQRFTRCPNQKLGAMQNILDEFFYLSEDDGCWHHKRCDEEIMRVKGISEVQSKKARKGISQKQRNPSTGKFISSPAAAGQSPAIKEEQLISKDEEERIKEDKMNILRDKIRQREINEELNKE